jgi:hypothetical protein
MTTLALLHLDLKVPQAMTRKDRRRIVKSFRDRTKHRYNVSIAEVGGQETIRSAVMAIAMVGSDRRYIESALQKIVNAAENHRDMLLIEHEIEWL